MNKFAELAAKSAAFYKKSEERADALSQRFDAVEQKMHEAFARHEQVAQDAEHGIQSLEEAARAMMGHNGPPTS